MTFRFLCLCSLLVTITYCTENGYYWRDYYGDIPKDAIPGGVDKSGRPTYIGQIFVPKVGLLPVGIYPGKTSAEGTWGYSVHSSDVYVKILCSPNPDNFYWLPITSGNAHTLTAGKKLVLGGYQLEGEPSNVGRVFYQGQIFIGKVRLYADPTDIYFPFGNEKITDSYQLLVQNDSNKV